MCLCGSMDRNVCVSSSSCFQHRPASALQCLTASLCHTFTHIQHTHTPPSQRRLAPLSEGVVQGDQLMCSYHGWQFNGAGKCTSVPQIEDPKAHATACASPRNCVRAFPVKVRS